MKDTASGLAFSFLADLPKVTATMLTQSKSGGVWIKGELSCTFREVFDDYYKRPSDKGMESAPHTLFANWPEDEQSIIEFTNQWGPLHRPPQFEPLSGFDKSVFNEHELRDIHKRFCFTPYWWKRMQSNFKSTLADASRKEWPSWETGVIVYSGDVNGPFRRDVNNIGA